MLKQNGEQDLRNFTENTFQESVEEIVPGVWIALSIGHSNAIFIEGNTSVILVDTLDTGKRGERLREIIHAATGKEVGTIIYTHSHVDHRGGAVPSISRIRRPSLFRPASRCWNTAAWCRIS